MPMLAAAYHPVPNVALSWTWDPLSVAVLTLVSAAYAIGTRRVWQVAGRGRGVGWLQVGCFAAGILVLAVALVSPLDALSDWLFAAHMSQHELLMVVGAPLVVLGKPFWVYLWALPRGARARVGDWLRGRALRFWWSFVSAPVFVLVLHALTRWVWHWPLFFEAAMRHEALHAVQHFTFFATAALFWWALILGRYGRAGYGVSVLFVFATMTHTSVLGALISLAPRVLYPIYQERATAVGVRPLEDQELAGILMWVPSGTLLTLAALALFAAWLGEAERRSRRASLAPRPPDRKEAIMKKWEKPTFVELCLNAEIGAYQEDTGDEPSPSFVAGQGDERRDELGPHRPAPLGARDAR